MPAWMHKAGKGLKKGAEKAMRMAGKGLKKAAKGGKPMQRRSQK